MQISVSGHHVQITEAIEHHIRKKLSRLEKHYQPIINSQVILSVDKNVQKAETRIHISGAEVFAEAESNNLYTSIDKMVKKLDRKMIEMKRKLVTKRHQTTTVLAE
ncbi:MAG: ribosome-associated translation inhibitor RaiA [Gammaproteobacteria bacterium]|jgi:putative sigma-54 modulation protein|nr:ribosome-associated translation inhibitor RaiA [Gammaproteobacteria bacterium]MBT5054114.1 ribosome-associated translation inhibitor RaiA [Gammaproteobacteria bacterium]